MTCSLCGETKGYAPGVLNKWHKCPSCYAEICPDCARDLEKPSSFGEGRICPECNTATTDLVS